MLVRVIFTVSTNSKANLFWKLPPDTLRNNELWAIWASLSAVKFTYKINLQTEKHWTKTHLAFVKDVNCSSLFLSWHTISFPFYLTWVQVVVVNVASCFRGTQQEENSCSEGLGYSKSPRNVHREGLKRVHVECGHGGSWVWPWPPPELFYYGLLIKWIVCIMTA